MLPVKPLLHQQGDAAGVVDVGVGDHHGVDVPGGKVQLLVVLLVPALLQAAVHQNLLSPHSTQWQLPVTALAAPKKVSFMGHLLVQFLQGYCTPKTSRCK